MRSSVKPMPKELVDLYAIKLPSDYETESGLVRLKPWNKNPSGSFVGTVYVNPLKDKRYWRLDFKGKKYWIHRVIYYLHNNIDPLNYDIDHQDGNSLNNTPSNLILSQRSLNIHNSKLRTTNTTGIMGVSIDAYRKEKIYLAQLVVKKKVVFKKRFACAKEAAKMYNDHVKLFLDPRVHLIKLNDIDKIKCLCPLCKR